MRRRGFTLIELLVVVGVIAVLLAITLPALSGAQAASRRVKCLANLKGVGVGVQVFLNEAQEKYLPYCLPLDDSSVLGPADQSPGEVNPGGVLATFGPMLDSLAVMICPSDRDIPAGLTDAEAVGRHCSYEYWAGTLMLAREIFRDDRSPWVSVTRFYENNPDFPVFADSTERHPGGAEYDQNALYYGDWRADWLRLNPEDSVGPGS
ncbi:MAG: type II secretion system protein [Phycisphaerales bacterium]|nr:type II secretion system protein [Phycisphaerales bacterium]